MIPALNAIFVFISTLGAMVISTLLLDIAPRLYYDSIIDYVKLENFTNGMIKAVVFGLIIALVSCYKGYTTTRGAEGVGRATTDAVVYSSVTVLIADYFLTALLFNQ